MKVSRQQNSLALLLLAMVTLAFSAVTLTGCGGGSDDSEGTSIADDLATCKSETDPALRAGLYLKVRLRQAEAEDRSGAKASLKEATSAAGEIQDPALKAGVYLSLAKTMQKSGDLDSALDFVDEADKSIGDIATDMQSKAVLLVKLAKVIAKVDEENGKNQAADHLEDSEKLLSEVSLPADQVELLARLGDAYDTLEKGDEKTRVVKLMVAVPSSVDDESDKVKALVAVAKWQRIAFKDTKAGQAALDKAVKLAKAIYDDSPTDKDDRLTEGYRLYDIAVEYVAAGKGSKVGSLLDAAEKISKQDPQGEDLRNKIDQLRGDM